MKKANSKTIVFITGNFVTHHGWDSWKHYFKEKGFTVYNPSWPHKNAVPAELRNKRPDDYQLAKLSLKDVVNHYEYFINQLSEKPILIGHSMGGLITQILVSRGVAEAAVVIHSVPPLGVIPFEFTFLKSTWKSLGLFTSLDKTYMMSFKDWQYTFTNGMSLEEQKKAYEENTIPESKRVSRGALSLVAKIDFKKPHAPLLFIAGGKDNIMPATLNKRNFQSYKDTGSITGFKEFEGNNHFVLGLPNWQEVASYIHEWLN
ncbi:alpha/beta hydrolase [Limibacter armeniacum]|uniref:alpha/beta hydrolase n=1 Tax=Limibacter armeniacum TaxID=466084 RepID=UPI002FE51E84